MQRISTEQGYQILVTEIRSRKRHSGESPGKVWDQAEADFDGRHYTCDNQRGGSATMNLARMLVAAGAPDGQWQARGKTGRLRFLGPSLHRWAKLTISESDRLKLTPYAPYASALADAISCCAATAFIGVQRSPAMGGAGKCLTAMNCVILAPEAAC